MSVILNLCFAAHLISTKKHWESERRAKYFLQNPLFRGNFLVFSNYLQQAVNGREAQKFIYSSVETKTAQNCSEKYFPSTIFNFILCKTLQGKQDFSALKELFFGAIFFVPPLSYAPFRSHVLVVMIMMTIITIKSISYRLPPQRTFECGTFCCVVVFLVIKLFGTGRILPMGVDKTIKLSSFRWWFPTGSRGYKTFKIKPATSIFFSLCDGIEPKFYFISEKTLVLI